MVWVAKGVKVVVLYSLKWEGRPTYVLINGTLLVSLDDESITLVMLQQGENDVYIKTWINAKVTGTA